MLYFTVILPLKNVDAISIYPFLILRDQRLKQDKVLINHEIIHFKQQIETLIIIFYILYVLSYLYYLLKGRKHAYAYRAIIFEREAYSNETNLNYLNQRKSWAWLRK